MNIEMLKDVYVFQKFPSLSNTMESVPDSIEWDIEVAEKYEDLLSILNSDKNSIDNFNSSNHLILIGVIMLDYQPIPKHIQEFAGLNLIAISSDMNKKEQDKKKQGRPKKNLKDLTYKHMNMEYLYHLKYEADNSWKEASLIYSEKLGKNPPLEHKGLAREFQKYKKQYPLIIQGFELEGTCFHDTNEAINI